MASRASMLHWKGRPHRFAPHFHTEFYVAAMVRGCCEFEAGGRRHAARAGDLVLINPFEVHTAGCSPEVEYRAVYLERLPGPPEGAGEASHTLHFTSTVVPGCPLAARLAHALDAPRGGQALDACLREIARAHAAPAPPSPQLQAFRRRAAAELERACADSGTPAIAAVAARLGMGAGQFSRVFHRAFGVPAVFFRNQLRLHRAEARLRQGGRPADVAAECGFSDQAHLIRELKKVRGVTPRLYAAAYRPLAA